MGTQIITAKFLERMRSSDYQNTSYAFAELIDNSFDAGANTINIISIEKRDKHNKRYIDEVLFCDDGEGMDDEILNNCLTFAYGTNDDVAKTIQNKKIGKFGMGLPNSSISQCKLIHVYSKTKELDWRHKLLDIDQLVKNNKTELPEIESITLPAHYKSVGAVLNAKHGTIVSWKDCDRLDRQFASTLYKRCEGILGRLFRYHLASGKKINLITYQFNSEDNSYTDEPAIEILVNDPLFLTPNAFITKALKDSSIRDVSITDELTDPSTYYKKFIQGLGEHESKPTNDKFEDQSFKYIFDWRSNDYEFRIKTSYSNIDIQKPGTREGGKTKVGNIYGDKMKTGNIYFTRHQREISCGHYGFYNITAENQRWWTIEIDFDADSDDLLGVSNTKQGIKFNRTVDIDAISIFDKHTATLQQAREQLWFNLSNKISTCVREVQKKLSEQAREFEDRIIEEVKDSPIPTGTNTTSQAIKKTDRERKGQFDDEQRKELKEVLESKYPHLKEDEIEIAVTKFDKSLVRGCVIYCPIVGNQQLWSYADIRGFLVVSINTEHEFYTNIIAMFREANFEEALTAIELFISSLAWEQREHFDNDPDKKRNLDNFRTFVGMHLSNYLQENSIKISKDTIDEFENNLVQEPDVT
jgi:Histidine kinase-, DNA gyrase B-, and HSP90-like ATPase